jgi:acyl-CoA dehydrogenase
MTSADVTVDPALVELADDASGALPTGEAAAPFAQQWKAIAGTGLPWVSVPEDAGGSGGTLLDAVAVAFAAGAHAVPLPIVETMLAGWLHAEAGLTIEQVPMSVADQLLAGQGGGSVRVGWGADVQRVGAIADPPGEDVAEPWLLTFRPDPGAAVVGHDLADQPRITVSLDRQAGERHPLPARTVAEFHGRAAVLRGAQMAGALDTVLSLTQRYTAERSQFGRPVGAFQAVAQHLVTIAQAATLTRLSVLRAARALHTGSGEFEAVAAKHLANEYGTAGVRAAYQAHGAIGLTREYALQRFTRRLLVWRDENGSRSALPRRLADLVATSDDLAALVQGRSVHDRA